ncbi:MAG: Mrp/NBP35 family ATP-binding protein [Atopobiaceae bacterium]|jgi:ATP-binding protein involved in chromosome partitioning|uniref:Iron-sulfur cluster carrier protein n=1 Tax=Olsenella absiana TaxID=3115222 RepID=A0ABU7RAR5_9ACTN|nr:Mrp/NBP35 family ATP-binding protein [Olsenella sp.]MDD7364760.1 Mrp/NBP35 family ATP-binding protein [Olsenella sp.]MDY3900298.1 Mrp/NBP35 family ATP-binding protein [Atopobiaceae bacterium]
MDDEERDQIRREADAAFGKREPQGPEVFEMEPNSSVKHVIGVVSGKGGVGKSLVTGILATELARAGRRVGILDADITGPSIPKMFGLSGEHAFAQDNLLLPATSITGIEIMSTNLVLENETDPVLWRGPMLSGVLRQFWGQTNWGQLDYLLVDMPPGTGDVALTVFQSLPIEGVVIVTSPQDLVQVIVSKAVNMASMMDVPVIGLVENMSYLACPHCGERIEPYGPSHLDEIARQFDLDVLGRLPIDPAIAKACDEGTVDTALPEGLLPKAIELVENTAAFDEAKGV